MNRYSLVTCFLLGLILLAYRFYHSEYFIHKPLQVTTWDAFGYYLYLPAAFIYSDLEKLDWIDSIDQKYHLSGGKLYQASKLENGNRVCKYLGGTAIMQLPFFLLGHFISKFTDYPSDGFSTPYQYAIAFGAVFYCIFSLFILRRLLLAYFDDRTTSLCLLLMVLATNLIHYVSTYAAGMSHAFLFPLYVLVIYTTMKWHERPSLQMAFATGLILGIATIGRPTEIIMLFIPLLWNTHSKELSRLKWNFLRNHKIHLYCIAGAAFLGALPQLIYWKMVTGSFLHDVGSKWVFLNPFFRVLFGFENGWFIYTPVTVFFIAGLFFIKKYPFKNSFLVFCLLNIWIVISWFDWRYGATYSTRALIQSYPVFAFPLAAIINTILDTKFKYAFYVLSAYLIFVNQFQLYQYDKGILHYRDMNKEYYKRIYLNPNPGPLDMSVLDRNEIPEDIEAFKATQIFQLDSTIQFTIFKDTFTLHSQTLGTEYFRGDCWIQVRAEIKVNESYEEEFLYCDLIDNTDLKTTKLRLYSPITIRNSLNSYEFYSRIPPEYKTCLLKIYFSPANKIVGEIKTIRINILTKKESISPI